MAQGYNKHQHGERLDYKAKKMIHIDSKRFEISIAIF